MWHSLLLLGSLVICGISTSILVGRSVSESQPNPIASQYPNNVAGTKNETISVIPIEYTLARQLVPAQWPILKGYASLLPGFPAGMYPLVVEVTVDHDVKLLGVSNPDYSAARLSFPYIDMLENGYSTFRYIPDILISDSLVSVAAAALYGQKTTVITATPPNDPYEYVSPATIPGEIYWEAKDILNITTLLSVTFAPLASGGLGPYPLSFYQNVTNQPGSVNGVTCDNQLRFFNTVITQGAYVPVGVQGNVTITAPYLPTTTTFKGVYALKLDTAFIENNYVPCKNLAGYTYGGE